MKLAVTLIVAGTAMTTAYGLTLHGAVFGVAGPLMMMAGVGRLLAVPSEGKSGDRLSL